MPANPNFDELISTTLDAYIPTLVDNVFSSRPLMFVLKSEGRIQNKSGGNKVVVPLLYAESVNVGSYSGTDTFTTDPDDQVSAAEYKWAQYRGTFMVTGIEAAKNSGGETQVLDLIKARARALEMTISEKFDQMLFGDGSGNSGKDFIGLKAIVSNADPPWGDLGGIDSATNPWWQSTVDATAENWSTWGFRGMTDMWLTISEGNDHPTHIFTTADLFAVIHDNLTQNARYMDPEVAEAGFQNLLWMGIPIVYDKYVDAGYFYFVNMNYITLYTLAGVWFKPSEFLQPINQDAKYKHVLCYGQLVTDNRKRHGLHTNLTAA